MGEISLYEFDDYRHYLTALAGSKGSRTGVKLKIANAIRCQPAYISQVLSEKAHLSLEQAEILSNYLGHSTDEKNFFILLVQKNRAGTATLKNFFQEKIDEIHQKRMTLVERIGKIKSALSPEQSSIYYSSWQYAAVHIAVTITELQTLNNLATFLGMSNSRASNVLDFLISCGLIKKTSGRYVAAVSKIRIGNESHVILKHHTNWRAQAIESLEREKIDDLHYSGVFSLSKKDATRIKDLILKTLNDNLKLIYASPMEEELYSYNIDFFNLRRNDPN
jgi:uncharacterized protein (TIGR02147 family)